MITVGVFGAGSMGRRRVQHLTAAGVRVLVYDPADGNSVRSEDALWLAEPDGVVIATPVDTHARLLLRAAAQAVPVLLEKPVAPSADALVAASTAVGRVRLPIDKIVVGYQFRFLDLAQKLRSLLGHYGPARVARFYTGSDLATWRGAGYGDALVECSHEIDAARWLLGPCEVHAAVEVGGVWEILLRHASGAVSSVHLSYAEPAARRLWRVLGERGTLTLAWPPRQDGPLALTLERYGEASALGLAATHAGAALDAAYAAETTAFLRLVREGEAGPDACRLEDGLAVLRLCDAARRLAES